MRKTANQIADEVLEKCAISPAMVNRALTKAVERMPGLAKQVGGVSPYSMFLERLSDSSRRAMLRGSKTLKVPGLQAHDKVRLYEKQLQSRLERATQRAGLKDTSYATPLV